MLNGLDHRSEKEEMCVEWGELTPEQIEERNKRIAKEYKGLHFQMMDKVAVGDKPPVREKK